MVKLSDSEIYIMHVIWEKGKATSFDILEKVQKDNMISEKTVRTLLLRMVKKKAIRVCQKDIRTNTYEALIDKDEFVKKSIEEFLEIHQMTKEELKGRL